MNKSPKKAMGTWVLGGGMIGDNQVFGKLSEEEFVSSKKVADNYDVDTRGSWETHIMCR